MFSKVRNNRDASKPIVSAVSPSIISTDMRITGNIVTEGEVQVDGKVEGDVKCKVLVIGPPGSITGEVDAEVARVHGVMSGQLRAKSVFLANTARMIGDVTHESLAIEPGAVMDGHCRHVERLERVAKEEAGESLMLVDSSQPDAPPAEGGKRSGRGRKNVEMDADIDQGLLGGAAPVPG
ncbi:MAG: polymer-forming cytoskeletal protein [Alphaproteobacteria bacterium]|nr:polymer-forming cytoskeletal protein [Alphaproteobacteria bacterium]